MPHDNRYDAADYDDLFSEPPGDDDSFHIDRLTGAGARVLELGCGTGRVMLAMTRETGYVLGVDLSEAMLAICGRKLDEAGIKPTRARTLHADITTLDVAADEEGFNRICAPFRVMQNLETDNQVDGLMHVIKRHLKPGGEAVLDIVMRLWKADELIDLIERHRFGVTDRFGGYHGEVWGEGPELLVAFTHA